MSKKRLLVIEDDHDLGEMLVTYFLSQGYEVLHASTGASGIMYARSKFPNLILLDVMLPDMEGFEVCRVLRTTTLTKYIPITFLTQRDARADKVAGLQIGADDYVTKPFDIEELRLRVERSIKRATRDHLHEIRTGLPTGRLIESEYYTLDGKDWHCYHISIEGYDAFRDAYGFLSADEVVYLAGNIIEEGLTRYGLPSDFLGITERSGFVIFTQSERHEKLIEKIKTQFAERARTLYMYEDADRGHLLVKPGTPEESQAPLMHFKAEVYAPVPS